jgi:hypothetical protein
MADFSLTMAGTLAAHPFELQRQLAGVLLLALDDSVDSGRPHRRWRRVAAFAFPSTQIVFVLLRLLATRVLADDISYCGGYAADQCQPEKFIDGHDCLMRMEIQV